MNTTSSCCQVSLHAPWIFGSRCHSCKLALGLPLRDFWETFLPEYQGILFTRITVSSSLLVYLYLFSTVSVSNLLCVLLYAALLCVLLSNVCYPLFLFHWVLRQHGVDALQYIFCCISFMELPPTVVLDHIPRPPFPCDFLSLVFCDPFLTCWYYLWFLLQGVIFQGLT